MSNLNPKQQVFVAAYIGEAKHNATEAARIAGYKQPGMHGNRLMQNDAIQAAIQEHLAAVRAQGIALKQNRIDGDVRRHQLLDMVIDERAKDMDGEVAGGSTGLLVRQEKQIGGGQNAIHVKEYVVDTGLLREMRELEKQVAQELGEWTEKTEVSGPGGEPLVIRSISVPLPVRAGDGP